MIRARIGGFALALAAMGTLAWAVASAPAQATTPTPGVGRAVVAPVTGTDDGRSLVVDPTTDLPAAAARISVKGAGYPAGIQLYVAVCPAGARAPANLTGCVGGPAAGSPTSGPWVVQTTDGKGAFTASLSLPPDASMTAGCVPDTCALFTVNTDPTKTDADMKVPLAFKSPISSSTPPTPSSAIVQRVGSPTIAPGATQSVIFSGFKGGEQVNLTLFSDPVVLSPVTADATGVARVDFVVPAEFVDGTHRLEAIGAQSRTVGVASFQVLAPTPTPSPTPTPTPSSTPSPTSSSVSSPATTSSLAPATAPTTAAAASGNALGGNWWIWLILAVLVLAGLITWFIVHRRNKEQARAEQEKQLADAASRQQGYDPMTSASTMVLPPTTPPPGGPPHGADPYGLLSGRNQTFGVDPNAPTQYDRPGPTQMIPPGPTEYIGGGPTQNIPPVQGTPPGPGTPPASGTTPLPGLQGPVGSPGGPRPGPGVPGRGGLGQDWTVPAEFAGDAPATSLEGGAQRPEGSSGGGQEAGGSPGGGQEPGGSPGSGQDPAEEPRTKRFRPGFNDEDPDPPADGGPRR